MLRSPVNCVPPIVWLTLVWMLAVEASAVAGDWPTYGHDPQRSGWAENETELNPKTVSGLELQWKVKVNNQFYSLAALTAPVGVTQVHTDKGDRSAVYVAGIGGSVFALDARTGEELWSRPLRMTVIPKKGGLQGTFLCPEGITATPVIDKDAGVLYVTAADGALYGLDLGSGRIRFGPVPFIAPFSKSWSLNLAGGSVYTTVSLGCGNGRSGIYAMDVQDRHRPAGREVLLSNAYAAGIWGRGGAVMGNNGKIYGGTADGDTDPAAGDYSSTVVAVLQRDLSISDYFMPRNWAYLKQKDLDLGSASPVLFTWNHRNLLAHGSKEGVVYLLDADHLGGPDHETALFTARLGNDEQTCCEGAGIWGGFSTSRDQEGQTWLYVPMGGPPAAQGPKYPLTNGASPHGSIMAFKVVSDPGTGNPALDPAWISGDFDLPDPAVIAGGVLFALSTGENANQHGEESKRFLNTHPAILKALDARTGKELYNSGASIGTWVHFSGLAIVDGRIYAVDHDSNVYCFGVGTAAKGVQTSSISTRSAMSRVTGGGAAEDELGRSWIGMVERQDDIFKTWVTRTELGLGLGVLAAVAGLWAAARGRSA